MGAKFNIPTQAARELFKIETNEGFGLHPIPIDNELLSVSKAFKLNEIIRAKRLLKPSSESNLYQLEFSNDPIIMVRSAPSKEREPLLAQCQLANLLPNTTFIQPLKVANSDYLFCRNRLAWIAYPYVSGNIYNGENCELNTLLDAVIDLELSILAASQKLTPNNKTVIPTSNHLTTEWEEFYKDLTLNPRKILNKMGIHPNQSTISLINLNSDELIQLVNSAKRVLKDGQPKLVHNDINHANVLIHNKTPIFLDLESIIFEVPEIAVSHALFKLVRHKIYKNHVRIEDMRNIIPPLLSRLCEKGFYISDNDAFFRFSSTRIISNIYTICMNVVENNQFDMIYDLEKKIHNLFELALITGSEIEPRTQ